jgi:TolB-like protein/DNA-binding winged helix-turn-helix (wHTH) protein/Flp pilus assembly protein TadD
MDEATPRSGTDRYHVGPFHLDLKQRVLFRAGNVVPLTPKAFDTLAVLAAEPGRVIAKSELIAAVWPDTFVEENNLNQNISALRKVLANDVTIENLPRRGYRLLIPSDEPAPLTPNVVAIPADPEHRPATRRSSRSWLGVAVAGLLLLTGVLLLVSRRVADKKSFDSLIVLPFVNLSPSPANEYFADGLTEELTSDVARIQGLRVVARTTAFQFKGKSRDIRQIGQQLNAAAALEGSVRWQGDRVRIAAQLNSVATGYHIWSRTYEGDSNDIFRIQQQIAQQIADTLSKELRHSALPRAGTENLKARNLYLQGMYRCNTTDASMVSRAILDFQEAAQIDPNYAAPWAGIADCYAIQAWGGSMRPEDAFKLAEAAADRALKLDDNLSTAHTSKAIVRLVFDWDWPKAAHEFQRALDLNPSDADTHHWYAHYLIVANRTNDALAESRRALDLDPLSLLISAHLGWHYLQTRQFEAAVKASKKTLELDAHNGLALLQMADAYEHLNDFKNALALWYRVEDAAQFAPLLEASFRRSGAEGFWRARLELARQRPSPDDYEIARVLARLGQNTEALDALERAYAKRNPSLLCIRHEAYFDPLENEARWKKLISALHLN